MGYDKDLTALFELCSDDELGDIVDVLLKNSLGKLKKDRDFQKYGGFSPSRYTSSLIREIRRLGGNSFMNFLRSDGVDYEEIVQDVARRIGIAQEEIPSSTIKAEHKIISILLEKAYEAMTDEQKERFEEEFQKQDYSDFYDTPTGPIGVSFIQAAINSSGFLAYKLTLIIANAIARQVLGHGLRFGVNAGLMRGLSVLAGPAGIAFSGIWLLFGMAGPAYRTTIPVVVLVATLRMKEKNDTQESRLIKPNDSNSIDDPYRELGISRSANNEEVKKAYRSKLKEFHPDRNTNKNKKKQKEVSMKTTQINEAFAKIKKERGIV